MIKNVVLITDCVDVAFHEMKWVIQRQCQDFGFYNVNIELVSVSEFSIINASFVARLIGEQCSAGTIISVVINPQKQRSARIFGKTSNNLLFFGANTGALTWFLEYFGVKELYEVNDPGFVSFGGKYVHAPNVAKMVAEIPFDEFGKPFPLKFLSKVNIIQGMILHIDNFGSMKIMGDIPVYDEGQKLKISLNGEYKFEAKFSGRMMNNDDKEWILYKGSSLDGLPELGTVRYKKGFEEFDFKVGDIVTWEKI